MNGDLILPVCRGIKKIRCFEGLFPILHIFYILSFYIFSSYLTVPDDVKTLIEGIKFAIQLSETKALKRYGVKLDKTPVKGCENIKFGCDAYWECAVRMQTAPENHQAGSCKMGPRGDPNAVVDNLLQVRG